MVIVSQLRMPWTIYPRSSVPVRAWNLAMIRDEKLCALAQAVRFVSEADELRVVSISIRNWCFTARAP